MEKIQPSGIEMHYIYYNSYYPESSLKNRFYVGLLTIWHGEKEISKKKMAARTVTDEDGNPVLTADGQLKTEQVETIVKVKVPEIRYFSDDTNYQQVVHSVRGSKSKFSSFDLYGDYLIMKQSADSNIEMAGHCGYDKSYSFRDIGNRFRNKGASPCTPCPSITKSTNSTDSYNYSLDSQGTSCFNCAQRYSSRKAGGIQQLLYDEYCSEYTPPKPKPKPKPKPVEPLPVEVPPKKTEDKNKTGGDNSTNNGNTSGTGTDNGNASNPGTGTTDKPQPPQITESSPINPLIFIIGGAVLGLLILVCIIIACCMRNQKPLSKPTRTPIEKPKAASPGQDNKHMAASTQEDTSRLPMKLDESAAKIPERKGSVGVHAGEKAELEMHDSISDLKENQDNNNGRRNTPTGSKKKKNAGCCGCFKANPKQADKDAGQAEAPGANDKRRTSTFKQKMTKEQLE